MMCPPTVDLLSHASIVINACHHQDGDKQEPNFEEHFYWLHAYSP
jgi:hypothetical protein